MKGYAMAAMARVSLTAGLRLVAKVSLYIFDWHSSLLFTFYKAQKYKEFLKRQKILDVFFEKC